MQKNQKKLMSCFRDFVLRTDGRKNRTNRAKLTGYFRQRGCPKMNTFKVPIVNVIATVTISRNIEGLNEKMKYPLFENNIPCSSLFSLF